MDDFLVIAITPPDHYPHEAQIINRLLGDNMVNFVHIRKPSFSSEEIEDLIARIEPRFHPRLKLHDHFDLLDKYDLVGVHLNSRNKDSHPNAKSVSISLHSLE